MYSKSLLLSLCCLFSHMVFAEELQVPENVVMANARHRGSASADPSLTYDITIVFDGSMTEAQKQGFVQARNKWQSIITRDYAASVCLPAGANYCGHRFAENTCIDDLLIVAKVQPIDGVGKILAQAGPCGTDSAGKIRLGVMTFDEADANMLIQQGLWQATITHEMGHVLGFGTLWDGKRLVTPTSSGTPYLYLGSQGNLGYQQILGSAGNSNSQAVVEDQGGSGTARAHWKEQTYDNELMTGYIEKAGTDMPLSVMTVRSLADLGYTIDPSKADPYHMPNSATSAPTPRRRGLRTKEKIAYGDDILKMDIVEFDESLVTVKPGREKEYQEQKEKHRATKYKSG